MSPEAMTTLITGLVAVLLTLLAWGNKHFAPEGASVQVADRDTGALADPVVVDRVSGRPIAAPGFVLVPGPAADERTRERVARRTKVEAREVPRT